jgi:hypothetical protein
MKEREKIKQFFLLHFQANNLSQVAKITILAKFKTKNNILSDLKKIWLILQKKMSTKIL